MRRESKVEMPTHEEAQKIIPIIKTAFAEAKIELRGIAESPRGGVVATATVPAEKKHGLVCELFGHGIVMVDVEPDFFGFAVRR